MRAGSQEYLEVIKNRLKFTSNKGEINNTVKGAVVIFPKSGVQLI